MTGSCPQPSGGSIRAIFRPRVEGNHRAGRAFVNGVENGLKYAKSSWRQADAGTDDDTVILC
jgi:hypothetical protein